MLGALLEIHASSPHTNGAGGRQPALTSVGRYESDSVFEPFIAAPLASTFDESFGCIDPDHRSHLAKPDQATHSRAVTAAQINPFLSFSYSRPFGEINRGPPFLRCEFADRTGAA